MVEQTLRQVFQQSWPTILTSWLGSGFLSAVVAGIYNLHSKQKEYVNDYYKTVINRRVAAYENLEALIVALKTSVVDESDKKGYHLLFSSEKEEDWEAAFVVVGRVMDQALWLSDEVFRGVRDLNYLIFHFEKPPSVVEFGKKNYERIATLRADLERLLARDLLNLHDVRRFLKGKDQPDPGFHAVDLK